jgi:hypothetical protein
MEQTKIQSARKLFAAFSGLALVVQPGYQNNQWQDGSNVNPLSFTAQRNTSSYAEVSCP